MNQLSTRLASDLVPVSEGYGFQHEIKFSLRDDFLTVHNLHGTTSGHTVTDVFGRVYDNLDFVQFDKTHSVNVSSLNNGVYFLMITEAGMPVTKTFVVK